MKKFVIIAVLLFSALQSAVYASSVNTEISPGGVFYTDTTLPMSLPDAKYNQGNSKLVPMSPSAINDMVDIKTLKSSTSSTVNILGLVEMGEGGIYEAARKGQIKTIHYVEYTKEKVWVPLIFIPIYFKRHITTVYGE